MGLRWWAVPNYVQFTASIGSQRGLGREGRWMSFGVRFETAHSIYSPADYFNKPVLSQRNLEPVSTQVVFSVP